MARLEAFLHLEPYRSRDWVMAVFLLALYVGAYWLDARFIPPSVMLAPAASIALAALFFGGLRLAPAAFLVSIAAALIFSGSLTFTIASTIAAALGAYFLRDRAFDPLFRRHRDTFSFFIMVALVSLVVPIVEAVRIFFEEDTFSGMGFAYGYVASITGFLFVAPLFLRWLAKPRFSRRLPEALETVAIFAILTGMNVGIFIQYAPASLTVPILASLVVPMFWIALRLRPRFLFLALFEIACFALGYVIWSADPTMVSQALFDAEVALIGFGASFFIVVSLEEDRRVNQNLLRSQLADIENAVAHIAAESRAKNEFIAILAHELRNPLVPVAAGIDALRLNGRHHGEDAETLEVMEGSMASVRRLLDDLLDISRIEEGKLTIEHNPVDLGKVLKRAILMTEHLRVERHQALLREGDISDLSIAGDAVRLEQVFSNLLSNASNYSNPGGVITISVRRNASTVEVEMADQGIGIDPASLRNIFTPFYQLEHGGRSKKGLGIGLAIVKQFVELHDGSVDAMSAGRGKGSRFTVRLPLTTAAVPEAELAASPPLPLVAESGSTFALVVDDNDVVAASIGRLLELQGCRVAYAYSGRQAIQQVTDLNPDFVLLDVGLPDLDGYAVAQELRARGWTGRIIAHTGYSNDVRERCAQAGIDTYIVKPAGIHELRRILLHKTPA